VPEHADRQVVDALLDSRDDRLERRAITGLSTGHQRLQIGFAEF
jgi:hypothetical protein